jgi:tyrosyl-tRNA synthetase
MHVGNLVPVMGLMHLQRAGNKPIAVVGGGTGLIGDPSGKTSERQLNTLETVEENSRALRKQLEKFLDFDGPFAAEMRNNADWLRPLGAIEFMRDIGKHFTVNYMMAKESVQGRMEAGISYTEFSYMLLQAYDYRELFKRDGVTLQVGGSDQWGNITAGLELIRRSEGGDAHALTFPLVTNSSGTKFGKTESGSVWLDAERTTPYQFYQFWINIDDRDTARYLRFFTLLSRQEIEALDKTMSERPQERAAQHALALDVTTRVHGSEAAKIAEEVSGLLFGRGDPATLSDDALDALSNEVPFAELPELTSAVDALVALGLAASKGAARRLVEQGGASINGRRVSLSDPVGEPLNGGYYLIKKGSRDYGLVRVSQA